MATLMTTQRQTGEVVSLGQCSKLAGLRAAAERVAQYQRACWVIDDDTAEVWAMVTMSAGEVVATFEPRGQIHVLDVNAKRPKGYGLGFRRVG